jgi:hypothetical protein
LRHAPFALLFPDVHAAKHDPDALVACLRTGSLFVLDDLTPVEHWPAEWHGRPDALRDMWLSDARLCATELLLTPTSASIVATHR